LNHAKVTGTIEEGYKLPKTMKLRARCEAEIESKLSLEREELWQSATDERGTRERERGVQCSAGELQRLRKGWFYSKCGRGFSKTRVCNFYLIFFPLVALTCCACLVLALILWLHTIKSCILYYIREVLT
jgi:hypothetical protein